MSDVPGNDPLRFFHPVLASRRLRSKPVQVRVAGRAYVLFRDAYGHPAALADACPHRHAPLSAGRVRPDGRLACAYHGWHFDRDGEGVNPSQPSLTRCNTRALRVHEAYDYLWIADRDASSDSLPKLGGDGHEWAGTFDMEMPAPLVVALDNFSENEHTPWVHSRLGWDEGHSGEIGFEAQNFDDRTEVHYQVAQRRSYVTPIIGVIPGDTFHNRWVTRFDPVRTEYTLSWTRAGTHEMRPVSTRVTIYMVPETEHTTRFHVFSSVKIHQPSWRVLLPLIRPVAMALGWLEVRDDAKFLPVIADTAQTLRGMRLDRFDKPLVHNRKLLERIYWGHGTSLDRLADVLEPSA